MCVCVCVCVLQVDAALTQGSEVIVLGDFNDYSDAVPDAAGDIPTSRVMKILREGLLLRQKQSGNSDGKYINITNNHHNDSAHIGNLTIPVLKSTAWAGGAGAGLAGGGDELVEVSRVVAQSQRRTAAYESNGKLLESQIDHVLVSPALFAKTSEIQILNHLYPALEPSDHWPVVMDIAT